jgi:23S rRNA (cytosine1962-C5)-methyltransferase
MTYIKIILKSGKENSLKRLHPWVFSGAIKEIKGIAKEGDLVEVYSTSGEFLALGHYQIGSIAVRVISFQKIDINKDFWYSAIKSAYNYRQSIGLFEMPNTNCYRLIHGEGDSLPGLIVDYYNGVAVVQLHSVGMYYAKDYIVDALRDVLKDKLTAIYDKSEATLPFKADLNQVDGYLWGNAEPLVVDELGCKYRINWITGQKTGFFLDQRDNRRLLGEYSKGKSVLNMFCYSGGFSVAALKQNAKLVHSVDSSVKAIDLTNENVEINFGNCDRHEAFAEDAFSFMKDIKDKYDIIILDPPAFAKHLKALKNALQGYKKLNTRAIEQIKPGGLIFTFSCSQVVSKEEFRKSVFAAAANTGRKVRILHQLTQPIDHPINIYHPESEYLKGLVIQVE